jgi:simple sugar transport system permease protein
MASVTSDLAPPSADLSPEQGGGSVGRRVADQLLKTQELVIAIIGIALVIYFSLASSSFFTHGNAVTLSQYIAPIMFLAVAAVPVLLLGEIDLSVGEVYVLTPFIVHYTADSGLGWVTGLIIALVVSGLIGLLNGLITVKLRVPSFITTLGTVFVLEGIILITSNGSQINTSGSGTLASVLGGQEWSEIIWALGVVVVLHILLRHTTFGLHTVAVGGNQLAAKEAGVRTDRVKIWCFVICSFLGGLMGLLDSYHIGSLDPSTNGLNLMFYGVAAAVIGGTALTGGRGTIIGAALGGIVLGILQDGFNVIGISAFTYDLILGLAILAAMVLNVQLERLRVGRSGRRGERGSLAQVIVRAGGITDRGEARP